MGPSEDMGANGGEEFVDRDPRQLNAGEWRVLTDYRFKMVEYRLKQMESRMTAIYRTLQGIAIVVIAAVIVAWLKQGTPTPTPQSLGRWLGL